tara:strand:+ start:1768 stop:2745 length:978 start_codon:yes stop_codon:yes gene_type:complete
MIISESKLRKIISKVLKESIFGPHDRDPAPYPGEDVPENTFFGYDVENKRSFVFKRREILAYASEYFLELIQLNSGIELSDEEINRLEEFRKNFVGLIIDMHVHNDKYPKKFNKIDETIKSVRTGININRELGIKEFLNLLLTKEIIDEILQLEKHLIPGVFLHHIRNSKEYLEAADDEEIEKIADYYPASERNKQMIRKRATFDQRISPDTRFSDFVNYYNEGNFEKSYQVLENIIRRISGNKSFASNRSDFLSRLSKNLGFVVKEEIRERRKGERKIKYDAEVERIKKLNKKNNLIALKKARVWLTDNLPDQVLVRKFLSRKY